MSEALSNFVDEKSSRDDIVFCPWCRDATATELKAIVLKCDADPEATGISGGVFIQMRKHWFLDRIYDCVNCKRPFVVRDSQT